MLNDSYSEYLAILEGLLNCDSPFGLSPSKITDYLFGFFQNNLKDGPFEFSCDSHGSVSITVHGQSQTARRLITTNVGTPGLILDQVFPRDGSITVKPLGNINLCELEGEICRIYTNGTDFVTGYITAGLNDYHALVSVLHADTHCLPNNIIAIDPHYEIVGDDFIISRFLNKAAAAIALHALAVMKRNNLASAYDTVFTFPTTIGSHLDAYITDGVSEHIILGPVDTMISPFFGEFGAGMIEPATTPSTSIGSLCKKLLGLANENDIFYNIRRDTTPTGHFIFGPSVINSNGRGYCPRNSIEETMHLLLVYLKSE